MYGTARYLAPEVYIRVCVCVCVYVCVYVCVCRYIQPYILFLSGAQWGKDGATVGHLGSWVCSSGNVHQPLSVCGSVFQRHYAHATNPWPQKVQVLKSPLYYDLYRHYIRALTGTILGHWLLRFFFLAKRPGCAKGGASRGTGLHYAVFLFWPFTPPLSASPSEASFPSKIRKFLFGI